MTAILATLRAEADADLAAQKAAYHKTPPEREVLGVSVPRIDAVVRDWREDRPVSAWLAEADTLWSSGVFEARIAAGKLLTKARFREHEPQVWRMVADWVPEFDGWAISDHAAGAGGRRLMANLSRLDAVEVWTRTDHLWTRRAALVFTLPLAKLPHPSRAERAARTRVLGWAAAYAGDREWFIQKAVSWWLRTLSVREPEVVRRFIAAHGEKMRRFAVNDATRKM